MTNRNDEGGVEGLENLTGAISLLLSFYARRSKKMIFSFKHSKDMVSTTPVELYELVASILRNPDVFSDDLIAFSDAKLKLGYKGDIPTSYITAGADEEIEGIEGSTIPIAG